MSDGARDVKRALRKELRARRAAMGEATREAASLSIWEHVLGRYGIRRRRLYRPVFCYVGVGDEVSTAGLLRRWLELKCWPMVPWMDESGVMWPRPLRSLEELRPGRFGVPTVPGDLESFEVDVPRLIVMPCLGVTRDGRRLGQGGGHYDRCLASLAAIGRVPRTVALAFACQVVDDLPAEPHDRRVDAICTEDGWVDCVGR